MSEHYCPECADKWAGTYTCEMRCTQCGSALKVRDCESELARVKAERDALAFQSECREGLVQRAIEKEGRFDALAAHVERIKAHAEYVGWKPGWSRMAQILVEGPETSLARLKAQWQAETLESLLAEAEGHVTISRGALIDRVRELHRQAEAQPHSEEDV